jgi:hypothetical protein
MVTARRLLGTSRYELIDVKIFNFEMIVDVFF